MKTYSLTVSSPDGTVLSENVASIMLRGAGGDLAVMAGHAPFITSVKPCNIKIVFPGGDERIAEVDGGLLTVDTDKVSLLSGSFKWE